MLPPVVIKEIKVMFITDFNRLISPVKSMNSPAVYRPASPTPEQLFTQQTARSGNTQPNNTLNIRITYTRR